MIKKIIICMLVVLFSQSINSQELYFTLGRNTTSYDFSSEIGNSNLNLISDQGLSFNAGYIHQFKYDKGLTFRIGVTYNEFNATGGNSVSNYAWQTSYLGIQSGLGFNLFFSKNKLFNFKLNTGLNISTIMDGEQTINNRSYDISNQREFSGVFLEPTIGPEIRYKLDSLFCITGSYNFSKAFNLSNGSDEKLSFSNRQFQLGLVFNINK